MNKLTLGERLQRNRKLKPFLLELAQLTGRTHTADELVPPETGKELRRKMISMMQERKLACEIPFESKTEERLMHYINKLDAKANCAIYIWPEHDSGIGPLMINSLSEVNLDFDFDINCGILYFSTTDLRNTLTLDYYEHRGELWLEVYVRGDDWLTVEY